MGISNHEEISLGSGDPSVFAVFGSACQIRVKEVRWMFLETEMLVDARVVGNNERTEGKF